MREVSGSISILQSSIKTVSLAIFSDPPPFQFYKVRLKREGIQERSSAAGGISILQSSIKTLAGRGIETGRKGFQFYKVRLKLLRLDEAAASRADFNSTKFD